MRQPLKPNVKAVIACGRFCVRSLPMVIDNGYCMRQVLCQILANLPQTPEPEAAAGRESEIVPEGEAGEGEEEGGG